MYNKLVLTIVLCLLVLSNCTTTNNRAASEEEQAMANALGITVEEMRELSDEEFMMRLNALDEGQTES